MQIQGLHKNVYKLYAYARTQETLEIYRKKIEDPVWKWEKLKSEGLSDKSCAEIIGISRATFYRYKKTLENLKQGITPPSKRPHTVNKPRWGESEKQLVLRLRRENPTYGKEKITILLKRDFGINISTSTVGRILKHLMEKGLCPTSLSAPRAIRRRSFKRGHAIPWSFKLYKDIQLGERVQIDHMSLYKNGVKLKHFQAWDRTSKFIHANVYSNATSKTARTFLLELLKVIPFKLLSIQVDGGSEFMAEFEEACEDLNIPLIVLPPKSPQYNGGVERGNRIFREEFYSNATSLIDSLGAFRFELSQALNKYNTYRPHFSLNGLTPMQYIHNHFLEAAS